MSVNIEIARNCTDALVKLSLCPEGLMAVCFCICTAVFSQAVVTWNSVVDTFIQRRGSSVDKMPFYEI